MNPDISNTIFQKAVSFVNQTNRHLFLTGKAGTGKTTFLKFIRENTFKRMAVVAPTGVAAINAGGVTIHSFFQLPTGPYIPSEKMDWDGFDGEFNNRKTLLQNLRLVGTRRQVIRELDLLVIDEVSMVRADLLDAVDTVMRHVKKQPFLPFGGVQMVYIGDLFQLPPVVKNEEWEILREYYRSPFFFDAIALQQVPPLYIELKKIYRQKDARFIEILNNIRNNSCTATDLGLLEKHYNPGFSPPEDQHYITLCSHNYKADSINQQELAKLPGSSYFYEAKVKGEFHERSYPAEKQLQLKQGAQIMFIKNDKGENRRYFNGKIGTVVGMEREKIMVRFPNEKDELEVEQEKWQNIRYQYSTEKDSLEEEELGTFVQYPIRLAWAITIHKSQGLTFARAVIDAGASFAPGQVYVSLSRLTNLDGLVLKSKILPNCISTDPRVVAYVKQELQEDLLQQRLEQDQQAYIAYSLSRCFDWSTITDAFQTFLEDYADRKIPGKENCIKWAERQVARVGEQEAVAGKFLKQLEYLFYISKQEGYAKLFSRTEAAVKYFLQELNQVTAALKNHLSEVKHKQKVKRYVKELEELQLLCTRKEQQLNQAVQLSAALMRSVEVPDLLQLVGQNKDFVVAKPNADIENQTMKPQQGDSARLTLTLFKQGKSIPQISAERGLSIGTVEGHLVRFVTTGEVEILDLLDAEMLEKLVAAMAESETIHYSAIKQRLGQHISYNIVRAVYNHQQRLKVEII